MNSVALMHMHKGCPDAYCRPYLMTHDRLVELIDCIMRMYDADSIGYRK